MTDTDQSTASQQYDHPRKPRKDVSVFIGQGVDDAESFGLTINISESGLLIKTKQEPDVGSVLSMAIVWGEDWVFFEASVSRVEAGRVAVAFINPSAHLLETILELMQ